MSAGGAMDSHEEVWESLDAEFDHYLVDMKPHVLKLPQRLDRQRCALWIRKLCDPSGAGSGVTGRKNRNLYAKLLLHMLKRGVLEGPFTHRPEDGTLKTLPTYMSIYFDEPMAPRFGASGSGGLPDWVRGELAADEDFSKVLPQDETTAITSPDRLHRSYTRMRSLSPPHPPRTEDHGKRLLITRDDSDRDPALTRWNLGVENPRYLRERPSPLTPISPDSRLGRSVDYLDERNVLRSHKEEVEVKMQVTLHEEKLKMQQKHDADLQKILERKNNEIEDMKTLYRTKQTEAEETVRRLEKKVQTLLRESQLIRDTKDAQIQELKKLCEESADTLRNQCDKKLHSAVADMEQEKLELQKRHTEKIQELLEQTETRLRKMEADYTRQTTATAQTMKELEARVQQLSVEAESSSQQRQRLAQEKAEVEASYQAARGEVQQLSARLSALQKDRDRLSQDRDRLSQDRDRLSQDHDRQLQQLHSKYQAEVNYITQQNALSAAKASAVVEELELSLSRSRQHAQEREHQLQQDMREQESKFQKEKLQAEHQWERKVHDLQKKLEEEMDSNAKKLVKMNDLLRDREEQLSRLTEMQRLQAEATEEFKQQVERDTEKVYGEMREQMEKIESDLNRSKSLREQQSQECSRQIQEMKERYEQQMTELKLEQEQEKSRLQQQHSSERDSLIREHERETQRLEAQLQNAMSEHQKKTQAWRERDAQTIRDLEEQVYKLKEELVQVQAQRKQQLVELGHLRDEEKHHMAQEHQKAMSKLRAEMEGARLELQRAHAAHNQETLEKAGSRLSQIEKEYGEKLAKTSQVVGDLQASIASMREESGRQQMAAERRLQEERREHQKAMELLREESSGYCAKLRLMEKRLQDKEVELQEQMADLRLEYELKIRGLMPAAMRHELEDTITSLKSQVHFLQKRAQVLQDDLTLSQSRR